VQVEGVRSFISRTSILEIRGYDRGSKDDNIIELFGAEEVWTPEICVKFYFSYCALCYFASMGSHR